MIIMMCVELGTQYQMAADRDWLRHVEQQEAFSCPMFFCFRYLLLGLALGVLELLFSFFHLDCTGTVYGLGWGLGKKE